jgi:hypothetical protein
VWFLTEEYWILCKSSEFRTLRTTVGCVMLEGTQLKSASLKQTSTVGKFPRHSQKKRPQPDKHFTSVGNSKSNFIPFLVAQQKWLQRAYLITSVRKQQAPATFKCMQHASRQRYVGSRPREWKARRADDNPGVPRRANSIQQRARAFFPLMRFEWSGATAAQQERISPAIHLLQWPVSVILDNGG